MKTAAESPMTVLALEFSSSIRSAAVLSGGVSVRSGTLLGYASDHGKRSVTPLRLIEQALREAQIDRRTVDLLAIGLGPGSYTGIRSAIAVAQGWQLARPIELAGIGTADCLAAQAQASGWFGTVGIVIDAQRAEYYFASYKITQEARERGHFLEIRNPAQTHEANEGEMIYAGPEVTKFFAKGRTLHPDARVLGEMAAQNAERVPADALIPIYLRETSFVKAPRPRIVPSV
ncbi:MAG: tRNA (adenosine(37)-N6)-threonylcarbamoyltransferase complex dimerization subunit type 1 TsaB [Verrucomicrobia bacterium]|nr:tRNA (adenosine(37)-N6)-threonylcarbamoyltransferase complex dimerization subunit type 1 TsaB [Verrucomicrobiota bacterium]